VDFTEKMLQKIKILIPVYNDFESLNILIEKICSLYRNQVDKELSFLIVNDNSDHENVNVFNIPENCNVKVLYLVKNMGHQRAIAVGLSYIAKNLNCDYVLVMDGDGEDKPEYISPLIDTAEKSKGKVVFAKRANRYESLTFKLLYFVYKICFSILTGKTINFGNFCIIPFSRIKNIAYLSEIWIHFSGAIISSRIPYTSIPLNKGYRYKGKSKMNFTSLIILGLSAIAVYVETLIVRLIVFSVSLIMLSIIGIIIISSIKIFSTLAIPGWATYSILELVTILIQTFFMSLLFVFFILNRRVQKRIIPILEYEEFIEKMQDYNG
jgi:polyisoprenyl-phosphate glycosyltransferase